MKIILTTHAKHRMIERAISLRDIQDCIELQDYTVTKENKVEAHKTINNRKLKVVYTKGKFIKILTVIET